MKVIIAGSRTITDVEIVHQAVVDSGFVVEEVVCGMAIGVDTCGSVVAYRMGIPVKEFPADWERLGKRAGHIRNSQMADYGDALILVWDGQSRGSANMLRQAREKGLKIYEKIVEAI
jgi:hypothetical protein